MSKWKVTPPARSLIKKGLRQIPGLVGLKRLRKHIKEGKRLLLNGEIGKQGYY